MDQKKPKQDAKATIIKPPSTDAIRHKNIEAAFTRINNSFQSSDNSQGFAKAKQDANQALAENKIILNKRFILESILGVGGMGTVYKAQDLRKVEARDPNPYVAVKVLGDEIQAHPDAFIILQRETNHSQTLSHPNIVTVHDFDRDGKFIYMTMELLDGRGLDSVLKEIRGSGMPVKEALQIVDDYCVALEYAHKKNIIHSDLKPGNIFVTKSGAKVLDFGIARVTADAQLANDFDASSLGAMTPAYASLEIIEFKSPHPSDDVYAAAVIAYELLTGVHPYNRKQADVALAEGLTPKRIKKLSKRQWNALNAALKLTRKQRTASIKTFRDNLTQKTKLAVFKIASLMLTAALAWFAYQQFFVADDLSAILSKGKECYAKKDYRCAIESARVILKLSPSDKQALVLLDKSNKDYQRTQVEQLVNKTKQCLKANDIACAKSSVKELENIAPKSLRIIAMRELIAIRQQQIQMSEILQTANACYSKKDFDCVLTQTKSIFDTVPNSKQSAAVSKQIVLLFNKTQQNIANSNKKYFSYMAKGKRCYKQKNYNCASTQAKSALKFKPGDDEAKKLIQSVEFAQLEKSRIITKVKKIMTKAEDCYQRKNYSCAIAKSESALEVLPNYIVAIELKIKAKKEITKLLNSIKIE